MVLLAILIALGPQALVEDSNVDDLLRAAQAALVKGQVDEAFKLADKAVSLAPDNARTYLVRGAVNEAARRHDKAITDFDKAISLDPKNGEAYNHRGSEHFKLGHVEQSIRDFDKFLELAPEETPGHWKRGISYYYAGRFDEGRRQFEGYERVDTNDVENAVWHFLCVARKAGVDKAQAGLLKIGKDRRVPMMEVYSLFAGKLKPEDVLKAAEAGRPAADDLKSRRFYAHLYLGLYYEVIGDKKRCREHMALAANKYRIGHYMGDVAAVHLSLLHKEGFKERPE
jgi:lipoprotein NlpI